MKTKKKEDKIPDHLINKLKLTTTALGTETGRNLSVEVKEVFAFVFEDGAPLCRLKYIGKEDKWGFAIFKWAKPFRLVNLAFLCQDQYVNVSK